MRCEGRTLKGRRCKKIAQDGTGKYCHLHMGAVQTTKATAVDQVSVGTALPDAYALIVYNDRPYNEGYNVWQSDSMEDLVETVKSSDWILEYYAYFCRVTYNKSLEKLEDISPDDKAAVLKRKCKKYPLLPSYDKKGQRSRLCTRCDIIYTVDEGTKECKCGWKWGDK